MPLSVVVSLESVGEAALPLWHGNYTYAAFLAELRSHDAALAEELHDSAALKPFTVSLLWGGIKKGQQILIKAGDSFIWRITALTEAMESCLRMLFPIGRPVVVGSAQFSVTARFVGKGHVGAGCESYAGLMAFDARRPSKSVSVELVSPTAFRVGGNAELPFPLPRVLFGSLLDRWNVFSGAQLPVSRETLEAEVHLSGWEGKAMPITVANRTVFACCGRFDYTVAANRVQDLGQILRTLIAFGYYCGVGWQSVYGMGQLRTVEHRVVKGVGNRDA